MQSMMLKLLHDCAYHPGCLRRRRTHNEDPRGAGRQSLQAYLRGLIEKEAAKPTVAEAVEQARREATANLSTADILAAIDEGRAGR